MKTLNATELFTAQWDSGRTGLARKTRLVDARPAREGEIVVTILAGEGKETQSPPARPGDMVVRNRCEETGNEQILVEHSKFEQRYEGPLGAVSVAGWNTYRPKGKQLRYFIVPSELGAFQFEAPWGSLMKAFPGDAIVQDPDDPADTYRIAAAAFDCTYEIVRPAAD